jgi:hypothetical protein
MYVVVDILLRSEALVQDEVVVPVVDDHHAAGLDHLEEVVDGELVLLQKIMHTYNLKLVAYLPTYLTTHFTIGKLKFLSEAFVL